MESSVDWTEYSEPQVLCRFVCVCVCVCECVEVDVEVEIARRS